MFKFLRKYSKWILAVGGTLLMITFLIPQAIQSLSQRAALTGATWATVGADEEEVPGEVLSRCQSELRIIQQLGLDTAVLGIDLRQNPAHWYLLVREAEMAGLVGGSASDAIPPEQMQLFYAQAGQSRFVDDTIGKLLSVQRLLAMYQTAPKLSDARLRTNAERRFHSVETRLVAIQAEARPDAPMPSNEAIRAHFETYRDVEPGAGEQGFGYRLPDRFKMEWMTIPNDAIVEMVEAGDGLNNIALMKHWQKNRDKTGFPAPDPGAEVPTLVRTDLLNELVATKREEIEKFASNRFTESWRRLKTSNGYRELPDDWAQRRIAMPALAEEIQAEFEGLPLPVYESVGDRWLTVDDIADFDDLFSSSTSRFGERMRLPSLVEVTKEFGGSEAAFVQEGIALPPLRTLDQSIVFVRITATDAARAPRDADEVRERIVEDLRRKADYAALLARLDSIQALLQAEGPLAVAIREETEVQRPGQAALYHPAILNLQLERDLPLIAQPTSLPVVGSDEETIGRIVDRSLALPRDTPLADIPLAERTFVLPVDSMMTLLAVELVRHTPISRETYGRLASRGLTGIVLTDEMLELDSPVVDAFSYDTLAARHNFKVRQSEDAEDEATDPDLATASAN